MEWYDYRLIFHNLKKEQSENLLTEEEMEQLWIPFVVFSNTENNDVTGGDTTTELTVTREGNFQSTTLNLVDEIEIFSGADNRITFQQVYSKTLKCQYQLHLYPFDTQVRD